MPTGETAIYKERTNATAPNSSYLQWLGDVLVKSFYLHYYVWSRWTNKFSKPATANSQTLAPIISTTRQPMTTVLKQRYFLSTKTYELRPDRIVVMEKSLFDDKEWEARYDQIGLDVEKIKSREGIGNAILFGGLLIVTSIMTFDAFTDGKTDLKLAFLFLFFCFMWGTVFWWSIQKYFAAHFVLTGGNKVLTFFINSPDEKTVREFIEKVKDRIKEKLKTELTTFDPDLTFNDQLEHIKYLKRIAVLTQEEFEFIREELRERHLIKK